MKANLFGVGFFLFLVGEAHAQIVPPPLPPPVPPPIVVSGNGFDFIYARRNLLVTGSVGTRVYSVLSPYVPAPILPVYGYPLAPYGIQQNRITIQYLSPTPIVVGGYRADPTAGINLDGPSPKKASLAEPEPRKEIPLPAPPAKVEAKIPPPAPEPERPAELPGVDVSKSRPALRPDDPEAKARPEPKPAPAKPKEMTADEATRMLDGGVLAFQDGRYGLAMLRFIQATELDKENAKARFLLGQSQFALGKYAEALVALRKGLKLDKTWPKSDFKPRVQLYKGIEADYDAQLKRLAEVFDRNPTDAGFGFLLAYQYWFDGRRADAIAILRRIRPSATDAALIDTFLAAATPAELAAR